MEEQKTVLLSLEFDTEEGLKRAANFRSAIDADKEALAELNKVIKKNGEQSQEQLVQREKLEQSIKKNTKARTDELRSIDNYIKASKQSTGSLKEMRAEVAFLTEKYTGLSKAERENVDIGGKLQAHIRSLNDDLKKQEGAYGDNRRSVGGYLDAIRQAPGAMGKMKAGITGISSAISVSPLGLLTTLLPAIIGFFNSSGEGADFFAKAMGGVNAVLQVGMKYLVSFAGYLVDAGEKAVTAFSSPKKLLSDLVEFMKTNLINRFKAFAVILEGIQTLDFRKVTDGVIQMGTGVTDATTKIQKLGQAASKGLNQFGNDVANAANAGAALEDQLDKLAERERAFALASAETERQIEKLLIQARNRQTSEADRIKLLDKAEKLELRRNQQELAMARQRVELVKKQNQINQEDADVQDERLKESQKRVIELERQSENIREKIQVRKDALSDAALEREKKREEERVKIFEKNRTRLQKEFEEIKDILTKLEIARDKALGEELTADEAHDKLNEKDLERLNKQAKARKEKADAEKALEKDTVEYKKKMREGEFRSFLTLTAATADIINTLADESSGLAEFQKGIALFQIALDEAQAISRLTASAEKVAASIAEASGPAGIVTGPLAYAAYYATQIGAIVSGIAKAKALISTPPPRASHYDGFGYTGDGDPHQESTALGPKPYTYHKKELIASDAALSNPLGAVAGNILMAIMGKQARFNAPSNFNGGIFSSSISKSITAPAAPVIDYNQLAKAMANMPAPVVGISDIKAASARKDQRQRRVTLGA